MKPGKCEMRSPFLKTAPAMPFPLHWYLLIGHLVSNAFHQNSAEMGLRLHSTASTTCCYSSSILASVLEVVQGFVKVDGGNILVRLVFPVAKNETKNSTHDDLD